MQLTPEQQAALPQLLAQIAQLTQLVAMSQIAVDDHWQLVSMRMSSPDSSKQLDLLPFGPADDAASQLAATTALQKYTDELAAVQKTLEAL